jgi:sporulation protein YlmC with PRC-barrel domain
MSIETHMDSFAKDGPFPDSLEARPVGESRPSNMLWDVSALKDFGIVARDGVLGKVSDVLFEDDTWQVRWLVVDIGTWLSPRKVLVHRSDLGTPVIATRLFPVNLAKRDIEHSHDASADLPVSQQPTQGIPPQSSQVGAALVGQKGDGHLRSANTLIGYHIQARDGEIGHLADFVVDDGAWRIRYLQVDTRNWLPARKVLLTPGAVVGIEWMNHVIDIDATRRQIEDSPPLHTALTIDRAYEEIFHAYYGWTGYWM